MEIRHSYDTKKCILILYAFAFLIYILIGFMPAGATDYKVSARISIPSIDLMSDVTELQLDGRKLNTPDTIVGSYSDATNKTLLIGHSSTVFYKLDETNVGDVVWYNGHGYEIKEKVTLLKSEINMNKILKSEDVDTLVIMTCAGVELDNQDATHRLILTAKAV